MSTPFLFGFSGALIDRLLAEELLVLHDGARDRVVVFVGNYLGQVARGGSLLSSVDAALLACDEVDEVFVDLEGLKSIVEDLRG
jgi:hypothetical protein